MTMLSFRVPATDAARAQEWADRTGVERSELLRDALHRHLTQLASETDTAAWAARPLTPGESALGAIADWGPDEDFSDWIDAAR